MILTNPPTERLNATALGLPMLLLHLLAVALLTCILFGSALYLYWAFSEEVSNYRRRMNAAAYSAQLYFDQREALLKSIAGSSVRNTNHMSPERTPQTFGETRQISVTPLLTDKNSYDWALVLTPHDRADVKQARARIIYLSLEHSTAKRLGADTAARPSPVSPGTTAWLTKALAERAPAIEAGSRAPIVWLRPPTDEMDRIFLFTPLDAAHPEETWIGLEVDGVASVIASECASDGGSYALYDSNSRMTLHGGPLPMMGDTVSGRLAQDSFGFQGGTWLPENLVLVKSVGEAQWKLVYYVPMRDVLARSARSFWMAGGVAVVLAAIVLLAVRHIKRKLVAPALRQYAALVDSLALNNKIIEVAPVGLSLVRRADGRLLVSNDAARRLLEEHDSWREDIRQATTRAGSRECELRDGRSVILTFASMPYQSEDVVICGISDITVQKEVERSLRSAKLAADQMNEAKTMFFATLSHEIRTPLYGIVGTMELLALTGLNVQQQQYLNTIQQSSATLLRTINDTLDLSRIEAGRQELYIAEVSPAELLERVVANFAARAHGKGLLIYGLCDLGVPSSVRADSARILQVLNNLVGNAVKFTEAGRIAVRVSAENLQPGRVRLRFQVADTGVGIRAEAQAQLFEPYFRADASAKEDISGSGLGLAICRRLSDLMGGSLSVVSEKGLGTSITFAVTLDVAAADPAPPVVLRKRAVYVDGAAPEVVANLCAWLSSWGAVALPYRSDLKLPASKDAVFVQAWPPAPPDLPWKHKRVRVMAPGSGQESLASTSSKLSITSTTNPVSIGRAVRMAQDGIERPLSAKVHAKRISLGLRVMVVEDNIISQIILREQLEHLGCKVVTVVNGHEALRRWSAQEYDVVITDLNMPLMGGNELVRALRKLDYQGVILGLTASTAPDAARLGIEAGMDQVLLKPLPLLTLAQTLHTHVEDLT